VLLLGKLEVLGQDISFAPSAGDFTGEASGEAQAIVSYHYDERSRDRERVEMRLRIDVNDETVAIAEETIRDRPGIHDELVASFGKVIRLPRGERAHGRYQLDVVYTTEPWAGREREGLGAGQRRSFSYTGTFRIHLRTTLPRA
jgi:hypothetical protein